MPHWLIYTSSSRALALGAVTLLASGDAVTRNVADVRPRMAVTVDIEGADFAELLARPGRDTLVGFMQDSLRRLLARNFGFLNWSEGPSTRLDTLRVRWIQRASAPQDAQLRLALRGPTVGSESGPPPLLFEKWARLQTRRWQPALVSMEWSATIDTIFKRQRADLVAQLFGRMPLNLTSLDSVVQLLGRDLKAVVHLRPDQLHAADSAMPEFVVRVTIRDTVSPRTVGDGELELRKCLLTEDKPSSYACVMKRLVYQEDTTTAEARRDLLARVVLLPRSLHLLRYEPRYEPAGAPTGPGGTVTP